MGRYYAPQFKVKVNGSELQADISHNIQTLSVTKHTNSVNDECVITIANPCPDMPWTHSDKAHLFWIGGDVQVDLGYADDLAEGMMTGKITNVGATFPNGGVPSIKVTCTGHGQQLNAGQKTSTHTGKTDKEIVEQIASAAGLQVVAEDTGVVHDYIIQANQTDFQFLRARAELLHYELFVKDKTLYFRKAKDTDDSTYTFVWSPAKSFNASGSRTLPLKSFEPRADALYQQHTKTELRSYDPKTKQVTIGFADAGDEKPMGDKTGAQLRGTAVGPCQKTETTKPAASKAEADQRAKADQNRSGQNFVGGTGHTIGVPNLQPGVVVLLDGLGLFSGKYYVVSVTHTIGGNGYTTDFVVQRNSTNAQ